MPPRPGRPIGAVLLGVLALLLSACSPAAESAEQTTTLSVFGPWLGRSADAFRASLEPFEERSGVEVVYTGTGNLAGDATRRLQDGQPPDVVIFPQPGLMNELAERGYLLPLRADVAQAAIDSHSEGVVEAAEGVTSLTGVLYRLNVKSLVWYSPDAFAEAGYAVATTWSELQSLVDAMAFDGTSPWCFGVEAFGASGWPATDWIEDIMLRSQELGVYDAWVDGELPFTDDAVSDAFLDFQAMTLLPGLSLQGRRGVLNTAWDTAQEPMFLDPPACLLHRQASFQTDNLDPSIDIGPDGDTDVFPLPSQDGSDPPLLVGGTFAAAGTDREETWDLLAYLASPEGSAAWVERGGFISPHEDVEAEDYANPFDARMDELLASTDVVRFDGSDMMYPQVGTRTFLDAMLLFIATGRLEDSLERAQAGYDEGS